MIKYNSINILLKPVTIYQMSTMFDRAFIRGRHKSGLSLDIFIQDPLNVK